MILQAIAIKPELVLYIKSIWIFENDLGIPIEDSRVIAPNGSAKFIYTYKNALITNLDNEKTYYKESNIYFIGIWDKPVVLSSFARYTGTIIIELNTHGVHRFTKFSLAELVNKIFDFEEIYGTLGKNIINHLNDIESPFEKVELFQNYLIDLINSYNRQMFLIDYTCNLIHKSSGLIEVNDLVKKTGFSKRYLDILFKEHLGISPKTLANISRFQTFYYSWANSKDSSFYNDKLYELYYDQAHFIKEFKRFTGYSPKQYAKSKNEFGKIFYKE